MSRLLYEVLVELGLPEEVINDLIKKGDSSNVSKKSIA